MSNVKQLRTRGFIRPEPAAALRQIADDIEAGLFGKVVWKCSGCGHSVMAEPSALAKWLSLTVAGSPK